MTRSAAEQPEQAEPPTGRTAWPTELREAVEAMQAGYEAARAAIEETFDPQEAFDLATTFREQVDKLVGDAAELRALMVERVWESEQLSLAALAKRIGVSKSRADQFIQLAKSSKGHEGESS